MLRVYYTILISFINTSFVHFIRDNYAKNQDKDKEGYHEELIEEENKKIFPTDEEDMKRILQAVGRSLTLNLKQRL